MNDFAIFWHIMKLINPIIWAVVAILSAAAAQIFIKIAGSSNIAKLQWFFCISLSLFSYSISFVSYYFALKAFDISKISPIMMSSCVALIALYGFTTGEPFNNLKISGIALAIISIFLISKS
jgi:drug/metabolite transporter (DMT)-like permease